VPLLTGSLWPVLAMVGPTNGTSGSINGDKFMCTLVLPAENVCTSRLLSLDQNKYCIYSYSLWEQGRYMCLLDKMVTATDVHENHFGIFQHIFLVFILYNTTHNTNRSFQSYQQALFKIFFFHSEYLSTYNNLCCVKVQPIGTCPQYKNIRINVSCRFLRKVDVHRFCIRINTTRDPSGRAV
jgi:hypothetical protein